MGIESLHEIARVETIGNFIPLHEDVAGRVLWWPSFGI